MVMNKTATTIYNILPGLWTEEITTIKFEDGTSKQRVTRLATSDSISETVYWNIDTDGRHSYSNHKEFEMIGK